jgi:iron complex outermembrane receptor protein
MPIGERNLRAALMASVVCVGIGHAVPAAAQVRAFDVPAQAASSAVPMLARQAKVQILLAGRVGAAVRTNAVSGAMSVDAALATMLRGTGLEARKTGDQTWSIVREVRAAGDETPQALVAQNDAGPDIIVTAQKREEKIQDVPIAISVFTAKSLDEQKIEGGSELLRGTPNVSFTKTNFASYNFSIRGIGTQALSVTTDPAVAISFNSSPMIRNRLFEQEYFDVSRIEVLRGPQGTLYGRNATAGVVNMIPNLATADRLKADFKLETGNFGSMRASGMLNVPLTDTLAVRAAGAFTKRDGYDFNTVTNRDVNGRDLWGGRASMSWKPGSRFKASLVWEHFSEDDDRSRTGKQLCHNDPGPAAIGDYVIQPRDRAFMSQGCVDGSLYDQGAFGVPNGASLPFVLGTASPAGTIGFIMGPDGFPIGVQTLTSQGKDPYAGIIQSRDLRRIATNYDPSFKATNDVAQFNVDIGIGEHLNFISQTLYTRDRYYSTQDYARFQSSPVFNDTNGLVQFLPDFSGVIPAYDLTPGGVYCDPQLGCSDRLLIIDLVKSKSRQWSQEFRLQSSFDGMFNFNLGANYLDYTINEDYYVFSNAFTSAAELFFNSGGIGARPGYCPPGASAVLDGGPNTGAPCIYIDPNPLRSIDGQGHNYFRSSNIAQTKSAAIFGEAYWKLSETLKLTTGLRWTRDVKTTTPVPSQTLLSTVPVFGGGYTGYGYPAKPQIRQSWSEPTGRIVLDWKPQVPFTDSSLLYASASHGYKAGGTNSPGIDADPAVLNFEQRDPRFKAEYVNAFEIGMKHILAGGRMSFNATLFYNDYKDYQVSQIQDRATLNENFNTKTWGAEFELTWKPVPDFQLNANLGLLHTRIGRNQYSIDVMDRTAGNEDWVVVKPWLQLASNCIAPRALVATALKNHHANNGDEVYPILLNSFCGYLGGFTKDKGPGGGPGIYAGGGGPNYLGDGNYYDPLTDAPNGGAGFAKNIGGNELPNAPHWTVNIGAQYTVHISDWDLTLRGDYYRQGKSWARVYNDAIDRLKSWDNTNLAVTLARPESDLTFQLYVKNVFNDAPITGSFLNSDDTGLTTNVFTLDPRIVGFSIAKRF